MLHCACASERIKITVSVVEKGHKCEVYFLAPPTDRYPIPNPADSGAFFLQITFRRQHPTSRFALPWGSEENFFFAFLSRFAKQIGTQRLGGQKRPKGNSSPFFPEREPVSATLQFLTRIPFPTPKNHFRRQKIVPENQ